MDEGQAMTCNCKVDQERFDAEVVAANREEQAGGYQGGFVSMRYVHPARVCEYCLGYALNHSNAQIQVNTDN